jgi:hypothetical protein
LPALIDDVPSSRFECSAFAALNLHVCKKPRVDGATVLKVQEALTLLESLQMVRHLGE